MKTWHASLSLDYRRAGERTIARHRHEGPLRVLQTLYPEGGEVAHNVLVHPPGGIVGGDVLDLRVHVATGAHGLVTTPGASRFYRSEAGAEGRQTTRIALETGARLEWLPLEAICYSGCVARNELRMSLAPGSQLMGWDLVAFGLPGAGQPFSSGSLSQHIEVEGQWLEQARIAADDRLLMDGPLGLGTQRCMGSLFFASGSTLPREQREQALEAARGVMGTHELAATAGATAPGPQVIVVRVLSPLVEPAFGLLKAVRAAWRPLLWDLPAVQPRTWAL